MTERSTITMQTADGRKPIFVPRSRLYRWTRDVTATVLWLYVIVKLFFYDFDVYLVQSFLPAAAWLLEYKFLIFLSVLAVLFVIGQRWKITGWLIYVSLFPLVILFWKIPYVILRQKSWALFFIFINSVISFFRTLKYNVIVSAVYLTSLAVAISASSPALLWPAAAIVLALLLLTYIRRVFLVIRPAGMQKVYSFITRHLRDYVDEAYKIDEELRTLPVATLNSTQLERWTETLGVRVLYNRVVLYFARRLEVHQRSGFGVISGLFIVLALLVLTVVSFACVNVALWKLDPTSFELTAAVSGFTFIWYSFNAVVFNVIKEIVPATALSQSVMMLEYFFSIFLIGIFASQLLATRSQQQARLLAELIASLEAEGKSMEEAIRDEYKLETIDQAVEELNKLKYVMMKFLLFLSK